MKIKTIEYTKTFNLGDYSNHKIGLVAELGPDESPIEVFAELKKTVERSHRFFTDLPNYEKAKDIIQRPDDFTGRDVKRASDAISAFESNYPDYIRCFCSVSRTLDKGTSDAIDF